ncbi:MAG: MGMT family protein [Candidatus Woesearchaeota archaeon]
MKLIRKLEQKTLSHSFNKRVYEIVSQIPKGKVMTYKQIANLLGCSAYRTVGNALNKNPYNVSKVPCHRVIKNNSELGKYAWDNKIKYELLISEGIEFEIKKINLTKLDFQKLKIKPQFLYEINSI